MNICIRFRFGRQACSSAYNHKVLPVNPSHPETDERKRVLHRQHRMNISKHIQAVVGEVLAISKRNYIYLKCINLLVHIFENVSKDNAHSSVRQAFSIT